MDDQTTEGRLLAHRRILQLILREMAETPIGERVEAILRDRTTMRDGQEDPGAVETAGLGVELAVAEEFRRVLEDIPRAADFVRPAGSESMREAPAQWDEVDEISDGSFPASDPPPSP
ncbi:hypothetical protein [Loktanella sp. SALINAS62]|uniref:hypothetical protein n=1 Tax=Loktanella sp. SALINAS62 TaxID=2706124 RepID=UPI001B8C3971|nr:hypothetical protein [Loktanella sp. SALINAS62]